ncbi:MAG: ferrous iron transporter B [Bdellovibrionales bacterium]|nr:ferrous iron transporter B [Bdellovibrionales bacterium]
MTNSFVAFVGAPNSGKTTLFNVLTKSSHRTVNYPGSTVDYARGELSKEYGKSVTLVDTPGTYSLFPKSRDEEVTFELLFDTKRRPNLVVVTVDVSQIARHLLLVQQLVECNFVVLIALTMADRVNPSEINVEAIRKAFGAPVVLVSSMTGLGIKALAQEIIKRKNLLPSSIRDVMEWEPRKYERVLGQNKQIQSHVFLQKRINQSRERTKILDRFLLHPVFGFVTFILLMFGLFASIFWLAAPFMDMIDGAFGYLASTTVEMFPDNLIADFVGNGIFASLGAVLVFVPQIAILFLGISILEDSGYLARACSLIDKPLSKLGLNGRSFVPLLSGYACAIPAMMAARSMSSKKEKFLTLFIIPLMSCSARLPVYALLLTFLFWGEPAYKPAFFMVLIYLCSLFVGGVTAAIGNRLLKIKDVSFFIHELPYYRRPSVRLVMHHVFSKTWAYVKKAGPVIFVFAIIFWLATTFPNYNAPTDIEKLQTSYAAKAGQVMEPLMEPMGGDWRTGTALVAAFTAREVFVSALALVFQIADEDEDSLQNSLIEKMKVATNDRGDLLFTTSSVVGLIIFFMIALQCMTTVGVAVKEFGGWKWPLIQLFTFTTVSYVLAVVAVQILRAFGVG